MHRSWPCVLLLALAGLAACNGEEEEPIDTPPVVG